MNRPAMGPFSVFAVLYMTAFLLEMAEGWEHPRFTLVFLLAIAIILLTGITRIKFLAFLVLATAQVLYSDFPDVANHVNLLVFCNIVMIVTMVYSFARYRDAATDDDYFEMVRPVLQASLILVYVTAGFHKLNTDFFDPEVSCAAGMLRGVLRTTQSHVFGVPVALVFAAGVLFAIWKLFGGTRFDASRSRASTLLLILCGAGVLFGALIAVTGPYFGTPEVLTLSLVLATAVVPFLVISWELIGGLLLIVPRFQAIIVPFSLTMHAVLAMVGFVDFGALAFSLLFAFIPPNYYRILSSQADLRLSTLPIRRAHAYFIINVIGGILLGIDTHIYPLLFRDDDGGLVSGMLFNLAALIFIWPILSTVFSPSRRPVWGGVPVFNRRMPRFMLVFLAFLFLFAMTPYLGLRTAGNFSMFSNLRTEGNLANHLLLADNPLKVWGYQEDTVRVVKIDRASGEVIHQYGAGPRGRDKLPVTEFRKWIYEWTQAGYEVPLTFKYEGKIYSTEDIVTDPLWRTDERSWEMMLMDFRVIQPEGPNRCSW